MSDVNFGSVQRWRGGGGLLGYVYAPYCKLVERLGQPQDGDGCKVDAEWIVEFNGELFATIYNWKDGKNYLDDEGLSVDAIRVWHIGGENPRVVGLVGYILDQPTCIFTTESPDILF